MPVPTKEQLQEYEAASARLTIAVQNLNDEQFHYKTDENEWSIHEIVIHLGDSETGGFWRLRKTIAEDNALLPVYDQEAWAKNLLYDKQDRNIAINLFTALRTASAALLRLLPADTWERISTHPEPDRGKMTLYDIFQLYLEHGKAHLEQIEQLKSSLPTRK